MLSETKEQIGMLINKIDAFNFVINSLATTHLDHKQEAEDQIKRASTHKLKLTSEVLRLLGAEKVI